MTQDFKIGDKVRLSYCKTEPYFIIDEVDKNDLWLHWSGVSSPLCIKTVKGEFRAWLETVASSLELIT